MAFRVTKLQALLKARDWTVGDLHRAIVRAGGEVTEGALRRLLAGEVKNCSGQTLVLMAAVLNVQPESFYMDDAPARSNK